MRRILGVAAASALGRGHIQQGVGESQVVQRVPGEPDRQYSPDAVFGRQFALGCLVLFVAFLLLSAAIWWFWMQR